MKNKGFVVMVVIVGLLAGCVVWQQISIMEVRSDLHILESSLADSDVQAISADLAEVKATLAELGTIESSLKSRWKLAMLAQGSYTTGVARGLYYLAIGDFGESTYHLERASEDQQFSFGHLERIDELTDQKVALLRGED